MNCKDLRDALNLINNYEKFIASTVNLTGWQALLFTSSEEDRCVVIWANQAKQTKETVQTNVATKTSDFITFTTDLSNLSHIITMTFTEAPALMTSTSAINSTVII